jgi:glycosyltransferase involved in cell wall biosynthesis
MSSERRYKAWNILDTALRRGANGHHYWEAKALVDELRDRGETVRLFTHRNAPAAEQFPGVEIIPTFSLGLWDSVSKDPVWSTLENFIVHARSFHKNLLAHDPSLFHQSLALFPTLKEHQLLGLFRWLDGIPQQAKPKTAVCMTSPPAWPPANPSVQLCKTLWDNCPPAVRKELALFCRTPQVAERFKEHTGMPTGVLPFALPGDFAAWKPNSTGTADAPLVVSFVGGARRDRGADLVADVVKQCAASGVRFFIQAKHDSVAGTESAALAGLARFPHAQVQEGVLDRDDYYRAIAESVVLLAYDPDTYRWRSSSVYHEALMLGAPVLVSAGTWMAEEVKRMGNGLIIESHSPDGVVDCIERAKRELLALRAAAARLQEKLGRTQGVARYISTVLGAFEGAKAQ